MSGVTSQELVQRARDLRPLLARAQSDTEERTYYSPEIHRAFDEARLYDIYVPARYGGFAYGVPTYARVIVELARGCVSAAWGMGLAAAPALQVGSYFGERAQDEVFGAGGFRAAMVPAPTVTAKRDGRGWRLNGTVGYCTGAPYATHFLGQALVEGLPPAEAAQRMLLFVAPRDTWTMIDDWGDTLGLRGSGSHSIRFTDARLGPHLVIEDTNMADLDVGGGTPGLALHGAPLYGGRMLGPFTISLAAAAVGAGYNALDAYEEQMRARTAPWPPMARRLDDPEFQRWYGAALARLATAEAALLHCAGEHMELCERAAAGGEPYGAEDESRISVIAREVILQVWTTVDECLLRTVGAGTMHAGSRFERVLRDLTMIVSHRGVAIREMVHRVLARQHLGQHLRP